MFRLSSLLIIIFLFSCSKENEEEYFDFLECNTENIYYNAIEAERSISTIISNKCAGCHGPNSSIPLDYNMISYYNLSDIVYGIDPNISQMPPMGHPQLTDCEKEKIAIWVNNNMPENE
ncbi:MAG: hypothetical protein CMP65_01005 [Flavobacteriales bacterium]|nr:hypothetical protein [Flavobacteriales bacterium]|tara:strand:- start:11018 stop:11374 length:357 start_codon:yes stop_codon:yes gene_type:complete